MSGAPSGASGGGGGGGGGSNGSHGMQLRPNSQQFGGPQFSNNPYGSGPVAGQKISSPLTMSMTMTMGSSGSQGSGGGGGGGSMDPNMMGGGAPMMGGPGGQMIGGSGSASMKASMMVPKGGAMYGPGHQRSAPYPNNPQQYMQSKRAQLSSGPLQPEVCQRKYEYYSVKINSYQSI